MKTEREELKEKLIQDAEKYVRDVIIGIFKQEITDEEVHKLAKRVVKTLPKVPKKKKVKTA